MSDLISREALCEYAQNQKDKSITPNDIMQFPSAQPKKRTEERTETHACDLISRKAAIDALRTCYDTETVTMDNGDEYINYGDAIGEIEQLPSAQPTLYGYPVEHLAMIARVLQKENFPPERISEMLSDVGRIVEMVRDEFEETLRKAVEQCTMT